VHPSATLRVSAASLGVYAPCQRLALFDDELFGFGTARSASSSAWRIRSRRVGRLLDRPERVSARDSDPER
jgi:hypothetical protein